jgi:hypothetical protein
MSQEDLVRAFMQAAAGMGLRGRGVQLQPTPIPYILDPDAVIAALRAHPEMAAALLPHLPEGQRTQAHLLEIVSRVVGAAAAAGGCGASLRMRPRDHAWARTPAALAPL